MNICTTSTEKHATNKPEVLLWRDPNVTTSHLSTFKTEYKAEPYLFLIKNPTIRRTFTQFRISNHKLQIEYGRYQNIPREERTCKLCNSGEVEDEFHLSFSCQKYCHLRECSDPILKTIFDLSVTNESKRKLLEHTMGSNDPVTIDLFSKFVTACFANRENSLKSMEQNTVR